MARRPEPKEKEAVAFAALARAYAARRILVYTDPKVIGRPGSPAYSVIDVYAPPMVMFGASITLLTAFGLVEWIVGMLGAILIWSFVQPPIVRWRAKRRARAIAFANPDGSIVAVVLNRTDAAVPFALNAGGDTLACSVPGHAIQTYVGATR